MENQNDLLLTAALNESVSEKLIKDQLKKIGKELSNQDVLQISVRLDYKEQEVSEQSGSILSGLKSAMDEADEMNTKLKEVLSLENVGRLRLKCSESRLQRICLIEYKQAA